MPVGPQYCQQCGVPLNEGKLCSACTGEKFHIDGFRSVCLHQSLARKIVYALKYENKKSLAQPMAVLMASFLAANPLLFDVLLPVPLHHKKLRPRGYNQAGLLAKELSRLIGIPLAEGLLIR